MIASTRALLTYPGLSFPSRTELPVACVRPPQPVLGLTGAPEPRGKGAEPLVPRTPYPSASGRPTIKAGDRSLDKTIGPAASPHQTVHGPAAEHVSTGICRTTRVYVTHQLRRRPQRASPKSLLPASPRHAANTQYRARVRPSCVALFATCGATGMPSLPG
jgi:hypothetical protein